MGVVGREILKVLKTVLPGLNRTLYPSELIFTVKGVGGKYRLDDEYKVIDFERRHSMNGFTDADNNDVGVAKLLGEHHVPFYFDGRIVSYFYVPARIPILVIPISEIISDGQVVAKPKE